PPRSDRAPARRDLDASARARRREDATRRAHHPVAARRGLAGAGPGSAESAGHRAPRGDRRLGRRTGIAGGPARVGDPAASERHAPTLGPVGNGLIRLATTTPAPFRGSRSLLRAAPRRAVRARSRGERSSLA